ncbi:MAG TPA: tetratricopeptide repeat protein [Oscillatoriaceae cyanobacterium]
MSDHERAAELVTLPEAESARQELLALVRRNAGDPLIHYFCACQHDGMGLETEAVPLYEQALALGLPEPKREAAMTNLGSTYRCIGEYERAEAVLKQATETYPKNGAVRALLAITLYNRKKHREATELLVQELVRSSEDPHIRAYSKPLSFYADHLDDIWANGENG